MFQDEARFGRISDTRTCWCPKPVRPLCQTVWRYRSGTWNAIRRGSDQSSRGPG